MWKFLKSLVGNVEQFLIKTVYVGNASNLRLGIHSL